VTIRNDDPILPPTDSRRKREPKSALMRRAQQRGREQLLEHLSGTPGYKVSLSHVAGNIIRVAGAGLPSDEQRKEAQRGAAELLDELAAQLRQAASL
jgi:hypothetical protein